MQFVKKVCILFIPPLFIFAFVVNAEQLTFYRNLKIGMVGEDVRELQKILNMDSDTMVAKIGIGSPGQESSYFGPMTQEAGIRFQEKNREIILKPSGLSSGTGFVGPITRDFLAKSNNQNSNFNGSSSIINLITKNTEIVQKGSSTTESTPISRAIVGSGPNYENISTFIDSIDRVAKQKGLSREKIALLKEEIYKGVSTTTDLKGEFMKIVQENNKKSSRSSTSTSLFSSYLDKIADKLITALYPRRVSAETGIPFGGALLFAFPCNCSNTWLLTLTPLPPTGAVLLDYVEGSQAFLSYNIPFTNWLLGEYILGANTCFTGYMCVGIPAEGLITPVVGSSLE